MYTKQFQYRLDRTEMIKRLIEDYVVHKLSHSKLREKYDLSPRTLTYIIDQYILPEYHRGTVIKVKKHEDS